MGRVIRDSRLLESGAPAVSPNAGCGRLATRLALGTALLAGTLLWLWMLTAERRAVRSLPPERRAAVYAGRLRAFEVTCEPPRAGLEGRCRDEARFLELFPECDARCRRLVGPHLRAATR